MSILLFIFCNFERISKIITKTTPKFWWQHIISLYNLFIETQVFVKCHVLMIWTIIHA
jgi:hypothetical protein